MTWFKVDDGLSAHPKVLSIPRGRRRLAAIGAWALAGSWCARHPAQEGVIPASVCDELGIAQQPASDLVEAKLWRRTEHGYAFHDFHDYNPTGEQVAAERTAAAERQRRAREKARESRRDSRVTPSDRHAVTHASVTQMSQDPVTVPPTRPDPTREEQPTTSVVDAPRKRAARATRVPEDWPHAEDTERLWAWAREHCPAVAIGPETANWQDWHRAKGDTAKDWNASWRTWMRRAQKDAELRRPAGAGPAVSTTDQRVAQTLALKQRLTALPSVHQPELGAG